MKMFFLFYLLQEAAPTTWFQAITSGVILTSLFDVLLKIVGAIIALFVGRWLIGYAILLIDRSLQDQRVDPTLIRYSGSTLSVLLNIALVVAILGFFGFETTTFAALLAGAGLAIGAAWGGLLANFAAGAFLVILRPFKVGDLISAGGVTGIVTEIGMFVTTINTADNVINYVGNNKIFSETIENFSINAYRRVPTRIQINHSVDPGEAIRLLEENLLRVPNVLPDPEPEVNILRFSQSGPVLNIAPACHPAHFSQVLADTNRIVAETFRAAGFPPPEYKFSVSPQKENAA